MSHLRYRTGEYRYMGSQRCSGMPFLIEMCGTDCCAPGYRICRPSSTISVVGLTLTGIGQISQNGTEQRVGPGDLFWVNAGDSHEYAPVSDWEFCWFNIRGTAWPELLIRYGLYGKMVFPSFPLKEEFLTCVRAATDDPADPHRWQLDAQAFLFRLLLCLADGSRSSEGSLLARRIREEFEKALRSGSSQQEVCRRIGITPRHAQRIFREEYGMTIHRFLTEERLRRAKALLEHTDSSLRQIAGELGFSDEKYFSTFFLRNSGSSPAAYRSSLSHSAVQPLDPF